MLDKLLTVLTCVAVVMFVTLVLTACVSRPDPMPKWKGYQLEFVK